MEEHHAHFHKVMEEFKRKSEPKFMAGVEKYGTKIWEYSADELAQNAEEEIIDLVQYFIPLIEKVKNLSHENTELKEKVERLTIELNILGDTSV